ncbi:hypothetical protein, conserved [Leishmania tarentolae]|uniref:Eukaryotic translation initiation factor 3 30 kDa subunit n=1 Tax=Leishmania tarentolae TaxID=5689 RepID=A0A640KHX1_LEITA|nr:hypothetical protein, conserved [Leishmania tarentolae]
MDDYYDDDVHSNYGYEDDEYDDAADDWEAEAAEEEQRAIAEEAARQARLEKKLATRAPVKKEEEEAVPEEVERAIAEMRHVANDIASGSALLSGGDSEDLIGKRSLASDTDVDQVGAMIACRLTSFFGSAHYEKLIVDVFERLTNHLTSTQLLNEEADRVHRLREELKRMAKSKPKQVEKTAVKQSGLDLDNFEDRGGATVAEENEDETGW